MKGISWWVWLLLIGGLFAGFLITIALREGFSATVIIILALLLLWGLLGVRQVGQEERWVIELFGKYCRTLRPGLNWIFPWIMKTRAVVSTWELILPLFEDPIKIDFKDGSAVPQGTEVFVKMRSPEDSAYRAIYEVANWREAITVLIENALRTLLNGFTIDEAITMAKPGYDLANHDPASGLPNDELKRIEGALSGWGFELKRITVQDFDLDPDLVKARDQVQIRKKEAEAATFVAQRRAEETLGVITEMLARSRGKTVEEIVKEIDESPKLRKEFFKLAKDLLERRMATDANSFVDIRVDGAEGIEASLLRIFAAAWKQISKGGRNEKESA